LCGVR